MKKTSQNLGYLRFPQLKQACIRLLTSTDSCRFIARSLKVSPSTIIRLKNKLESQEISNSDEISRLSPKELYEKVYPRKQQDVRNDSQNKYLPDFEKLTSVMIEKKLNITQLYALYESEALSKELQPLSLSYFSARIKIARDLIESDSPEFYYAQTFPYGLYAQLDYTGDKYELLTYNGRITCWIMAIAFPASYYVYAGFVTAQSTAESCRVLCEGFRYLGNRHPSILTVDNARCWCTQHKPHAEAVINENFACYLQEMGMCAEAAPPYTPQRKSCAEHSVGRIQSVMSSLKHEFATTLRTLQEHNKILMEKVEALINKGPFRRSTTLTRDYLFKTYELPLLIPEKKIPEYMGEPISVVVPGSYMVTVQAHQYSVPYLYIKKRVDIYLTNDLVIIKHEGKEIARHLRTDGEGITAVEGHKPSLHQKIDANNRIYASLDDVTSISKALDDGVNRFCLSKIEYDKNNCRAESVTIKTCRAVINGYKRCFFKQLYSEACISVLNLEPYKWSSYSVAEMYKELQNEYNKNQKIQHQEEFEIFRPTEPDDAHLRDFDSFEPDVHGEQS